MSAPLLTASDQIVNLDELGLFLACDEWFGEVVRAVNEVLASIREVKEPGEGGSNQQQCHAQPQAGFGATGDRFGQTHCVGTDEPPCDADGVQ